MPAIDASVQPAASRRLSQQSGSETVAETVAEGVAAGVAPTSSGPLATDTASTADTFGAGASSAGSPTRAPMASPASSAAAPRVRRAMAGDALSGSTLKTGDTGPAVQELQRALNSHGASVDEDGAFGAQTAAAVRDFQRAHGLTDDGRVGPLTRGALAAGPAPAAPVATAPASPAGPVPAGTVDVGAATRADIQAMRASPDAATRRMASTVERAQRAYADSIASGGRVLVTTSAGNGGQPVVTLVPPGFDPNKAARVHTHYHGFNATVGDPKGHSSGTTARIEAVQRADPQAVFVLPECGNAQPGSYHSDWSNVRSQARTTSDALAGAGVANVGTRVVSAHSGGGEALRRAMQAQTDGSGVAADRLELQDCLYGSESAIAAWGKTAAGAEARQVVYLHGTNTPGRDEAIARAFGSRYQRVEVSAGHGFGAHNRTVADFMDASV